MEENSFSVHPARLKVILRGIGDDERTTINNIFEKNLTIKCGPTLARKTKADRDFQKIRKRFFAEYYANREISLRTNVRYRSSPRKLELAEQTQTHAL